MSKFGSFAHFGQQSYVVPTNTGGYDNVLGQLRSAMDDDIVSGNVVQNSQMVRELVLVKNGSGVTIPAGTPLNWVSGYWGTQVQACPVGQAVRGFAPGYVSGTTSATIPANAYFYMVYAGPTLALTTGSAIAVDNGLSVNSTAGQLTAARAQFASTGASAAVTNSTSNTAFATNQYTYIANSLLAGDVIRLTGQCPITWASGTIRFQVLIGTTVVSDTQTYTPATGTVFSFDTSINILTIGASGTLTGSGVYATTAGGAQTAFAALGSTAVDTTATQLVSVKVQWSAASTSNSVTLARFQAQRNIASSVNSDDQCFALSDVVGAGTAARTRVRARCQW